MARVNVDQKALTDPRFYRLGIDLGAEPEVAHAVGLYTMILVWSECIQRVVYVLDGWVLQSITKKTNGHEILLSADLVVKLANDRFRVRGARERCLYMKEAQERARVNGQKGGRPRKPTLVSTETKVESSSLTLTPTLSTSESEVVSKASTTTLTVVDSPKNGEVDGALVRIPKKPPGTRAKKSPLVNGARVERMQEDFMKLYEFYPRHVGRDAAWRAFVKLDPDLETLQAIVADVKKRTDAGDWMPDDPERVQYIPHMSTYLNQRRWTDEA
jgi:hypothetical protein